MGLSKGAKSGENGGKNGGKREFGGFRISANGVVFLANEVTFFSNFNLVIFFHFFVMFP